MLYGTICHLLQKTHEQLPREVIFQGHLMPRFSLKQDKKKKKTPPSWPDIVLHPNPFFHRFATQKTTKKLTQSHWPDHFLLLIMVTFGQWLGYFLFESRVKIHIQWGPDVPLSSLIDKGEFCAEKEKKIRGEESKKTSQKPSFFQLPN